MAEEKVDVIIKLHKRKYQSDVEIPLNITANEPVLALNTAYDLGIDMTNVKNCYLKSENPIALIRGNKTLSEFGIHNGTIINYTE